MTAHRSLVDLGLAAYDEDDPYKVLGNITAGAGVLPNTRDLIQKLSSINATTAEIRTLPDPIKSGLLVGLVFVLKTAQNLVVRSQTPLFLGTTVTQPAITQNGQFITFTTVDQYVQLSSVPCSKTSHTGTQSTFTNVTGFRWVVDVCDGPAIT